MVDHWLGYLFTLPPPPPPMNTPPVTRGGVKNSEIILTAVVHQKAACTRRFSFNIAYFTLSLAESHFGLGTELFRIRIRPSRQNRARSDSRKSTRIRVLPNFYTINSRYTFFFRHTSQYICCIALIINLANKYGKKSTIFEEFTQQ